MMFYATHYLFSVLFSKNNKDPRKTYYYKRDC